MLLASGELDRPFVCISECSCLCMNTYLSKSFSVSHTCSYAPGAGERSADHIVWVFVGLDAEKEGYGQGKGEVLGGALLPGRGGAACGGGGGVLRACVGHSVGGVGDACMVYSMARPDEAVAWLTRESGQRNRRSQRSYPSTRISPSRYWCSTDGA